MKVLTPALIVLILATTAEATPDRRAFAEVGVDIALQESAAGASLTGGYWLSDYTALELALGYTGSAGQPGVPIDAVRRNRTSVRGGVRVGLPLTVTPVASIHIGYERGAGPWAYGIQSGTDTRHSLALDAAAGLQVTWRWFTASTLVHTRTALSSTTDRTSDTGFAHAGVSLARAAAPEAGDLLYLGFETRVGVRF